jgi:diguanylate cyclase (GGDEF)-like protein
MFHMASAAPNSITLKPMPRIMEIAEEKRRRARDALVTSMKVPAERWGKAEDSIRSMSSGDMITLTDPQDRKHGHRLVWIAPNQSRYVFVDGEGHLSSDMSLDELTSLLLKEKVSILEGWDVPLMDRATYSMLLSIHKKLLSQSNSDTLTGLQNRRAFELEVEKVLERTRIDKTKNILCFLDLDHFSLVNSMCSHDEGDRLLKEVADILRQHAPEKTRIGRLGGDEFALLMPDLSRTEGVMAVRALQQAMHSHKFSCKSKSYRLAACFGIAEINEFGESGTRLMSAVEHACRNAKEAGRDRIEIHHESNGELTRREKLINMVGQIRDAMDNDRMQLVCQRILPVTDRETEQAPYYEILLRVQDENGQPVSHEQFIQAAEMYNRTIDVDRWVVHHVVEWLEQRQTAGKPLPIVSVNLSGRSVNNKEFMDTIAERIIKCTIPRNHLCFEITETAAIGNMGQATHFINRIKRLGCSFSLDDFGTGVSSYSYLKALPVDYIKIDGSFVRNCHQEPHDLAVIKSINELGHAMGKKTIAEFVENEDILTRLNDIGVDYAQGYGIEMPIPITQLN